MDRSITVRGIGEVEFKADSIMLELGVEHRHMEYRKCMKQAAKRLNSLRKVLAEENFPDGALQTVEFRVIAEYRHVRDSRGEEHEVFVAWCCRQVLKLEMPFDFARFARVLDAAVKSGARPNVRVRFAVSDSRHISEALIKNAAEDARRRAEFLCVASGATLGDLVKIECEEEEIPLYSDTEYQDSWLEDSVSSGAAVLPEIVPEEIEACASATFVWAIQERGDVRHGI